MTATLEAKRAELAAIRARIDSNISNAALDIQRRPLSNLDLRIQVAALTARLETIKADTARICRKLAGEDRRADR